MEQEQITFDKYNYVQVPQDVLEYAEKYNGICGEAAIAALLDMTVKDVFDKGGIHRESFKGYTLQKEMREILSKLGHNCIQKGVKDKFILPDIDYGIIRVSFGDPKQHWSKTASLSHYIAIKRFMQGWYIYDNAISEFNGEKINGIWIEKSEYYKVMKAESTFITSYMELKNI